MRLRRLPHLPALPLPVSTLVSALLLLVPAAVLLSTPRRAASGLDRLLPLAALVQSFRAQPADAAPPLWQQRLGAAEAQRLWQGQRRLWWQFWGVHGDAGAYLVLPVPRHQALPAQAIRIDDLAVVSPDPLARQLLVEQLKARRRAPRGLAQRCSASLQQSPSVLWNAAAIGQLLGPLAPLAQEVEQGCLVLEPAGKSLSWQGQADASEAPLAAAPPPLAPPASPPLSGPELLDLRGDRLDLLLRGPLESNLLRQVLAQTYGLGPEPLRRLRALPFSLRLSAQPSGPFRAGLVLELRPGSGDAAGRPTSSLAPWLAQLGSTLETQGLVAGPAQAGLTSWSREDGTVVGGWRSLADGRLLLFLGPVPNRLPMDSPLGPASWRLRLQPAALARTGLLPQPLPLVVQRAEQLVLQGRPLGQRSGERVSALSGRLNLP